MTRLQWFQVSKLKPPEIKKLADRMLAEKYQDDRGWGFQVAEVRKNFLNGKFIEKNKRTESFTDPFGKIQSYEIIWRLIFVSSQNGRNCGLTIHLEVWDRFLQPSASV
jgi:hypothetical protein